MVTKLQRSDSIDRITELLGPGASELLNHSTQTISKDNVQLPGPDFVDRVWSISDRSPAVLRSLQSLFDNGRLAGTGYLSILPVDQGIEHSAGASFAPNPEYFDPANIVKLAIEGGCNAVASTFGVLGSVARKYAHKIPFIVKINQHARSLKSVRRLHSRTSSAWPAFCGATCVIRSSKLPKATCMRPPILRA